MTLLHERFLEPPVRRRCTVRRADATGLSGDMAPGRAGATPPRPESSRWQRQGAA